MKLPFYQEFMDDFAYFAFLKHVPLLKMFFCMFKKAREKGSVPVPLHEKPKTKTLRY